MGKPIATKKSGGICFAFPDVCQTPSSTGQIPIPYPNIGQLSDATQTASTVKANGNEVITSSSSIRKTSGDQAGSGGGLAGGGTGDEVKFVSYSMTVKAGGAYVVRMFDTTTQNKGNATGQVLGGETNVLVGD